MSRHTFEDKLKAIDFYLNKRNSYRETAKLMSATKSDIIKWVALYQKQGEKGLQPTYTNYSVKFKMDVLTYMEKTGASIREASYVFNIPSYSTVAKWKRTFEEQGKDGLFPKKRSRPKMKKKPTENLDTDKTNEELLKENEYLRMEIAYLKKLNGLSSSIKGIKEREKAQIVFELRHDYKVVDLIKVAKIARSTYYYWTKAFKGPDKYKEMKQLIKHIFHEHQGRYGYRRITLELGRLGYSINHKTVYRLMKELGLKSLVRLKKYRSYRGKTGRIASNILKRDFEASKPNEKWVTDITEFHLFGEKLYLSPILDLFNGEIISYHIDKRPVFSLVTTMLNEAFNHLQVGERPILHSDQGWHYQMTKYQHLLKENNITQSMSRKGNCFDNAVIENFFGLLKSELLYLQEFESMEHFQQELERYIVYYNHKRIKVKLKGLTPVEYRIQSSFAA
ncbi:IS3 family transposase [Priestia megaterium]|uniref:IS3 family transposase n=7 Tax=Priestia TaxID=2800373 RepID=UPI0035C7A75F